LAITRSGYACWDQAIAVIDKTANTRRIAIGEGPQTGTFEEMIRDVMALAFRFLQQSRAGQGNHRLQNRLQSVFRGAGNRLQTIENIGGRSWASNQ
jgi:hypothetical protein